MFKRNKIKQITAAIDSSNNQLFTLGLGRDGQVYVWNSSSCQWLLFKALPVEGAENAKAS